jgi:hypothetical protein
MDTGYALSYNASWIPSMQPLPSDHVACCRQKKTAQMLKNNAQNFKNTHRSAILLELFSSHTPECAHLVQSDAVFRS